MFSLSRISFFSLISRCRKNLIMKLERVNGCIQLMKSSIAEEHFFSGQHPTSASSRQYKTHAIRQKLSSRAIKRQNHSVQPRPPLGQRISLQCRTCATLRDKYLRLNRQQKYRILIYLIRTIALYHYIRLIQP